MRIFKLVLVKTSQNIDFKISGTKSSKLIFKNPNFSSISWILYFKESSFIEVLLQNILDKLKLSTWFHTAQRGIHRSSQNSMCSSQVKMQRSSMLICAWKVYIEQIRFHELGIEIQHLMSINGCEGSNQILGQMHMIQRYGWHYSIADGWNLNGQSSPRWELTCKQGYKF